MPKKKENRRASRISVSLPVKYKIIGKKGARWKKAFCKDVGGLGFGLIINEPIKEKEHLKISLSRKDKAKTMSANCRVVWCVKDGSGIFRAGVEIMKVEDPLPFIEFIGDMLLNLR